MNQPELGKLISEIRNQKGITQKHLSESCNIDIRTVQRIECGEVIPRHSTLKLIAECLEYDFHLANVEPISQNSVSKDLLLISFIAGILNIINWVFYVSIIPIKSGGFNLHPVFSMMHLLTTVFFYIGFFVLGRNYKNLILQIVSVIIIFIVPFMVITDIGAALTQASFIQYIIRFMGALLGINGIIFGIGLLLIKSKYSVIYKIGGISQILVNPLFVIPVTLLNRIGFYISIPSLILFVLILFVEYKKPTKSVEVSG